MRCRIADLVFDWTAFELLRAAESIGRALGNDRSARHGGVRKRDWNPQQSIMRAVAVRRGEP